MDKRKILLLLFWLTGMLFPMNLLWKKSSIIRRIFDALISSELSHVIGHMILFGGLVFLLFFIFDLPLTKRTAVILGVSVLAVGMGQEFLQLQVKQRAFSWPEVFDLCVDMVGGTLGWYIYQTYLRYRRYLQIAFFILRDAV